MTVTYLTDQAALSLSQAIKRLLVQAHTMLGCDDKLAKSKEAAAAAASAA